MASATPDLWLPSQPQSITALWSVPNYTAWWQSRYMKVVIAVEPMTSWSQVQIDLHVLLILAVVMNCSGIALFSGIICRPEHTWNYFIICSYVTIILCILLEICVFYNIMEKCCCFCVCRLSLTRPIDSWWCVTGSWSYLYIVSFCSISWYFSCLWCVIFYGIFKISDKFLWLCKCSIQYCPSQH